MAAPEAPRPPPPRFVQELDVLVRARYPLVYLVTSEEQRLEAILAELAEAHGKALLGWSVAKGFRREGGAKLAAGLDGAREPLAGPGAQRDAQVGAESRRFPFRGGAPRVILRCHARFSRVFDRRDP